ncbi:MAG: SDR family oxidoreductase [Pseudomonadales bacterium]
MQYVLVTAGASGIGKAMVEAFIARGDCVAAVDLDPSALEQMRQAHPEHIFECLDIADEGAVDALFQRLQQRWGRLDVVCANAGTAGPAGAVETLDYSAWQACHAVNVGGAFLTARGAAAIFKQQRSGLLLFTSSTAGLMGYPYRSAYASAKWAVIGMMETLAMELGEHGIRVNALCPGAVEGERMDAVIAAEAAAKDLPEQQVREFYVRGVSMKTWVKAEDIANTALFLASPGGNKISGQAISIDGNTETLAP